MADFFVIPGKKSTYYARKFLNIGKLKLKKQKYFEAIENFNKSLCYAEEGSHDISLAYECRSEVYHEIAKFAQCKNGIEGSDDNEVLAIHDDPWDFFKLSHPANDKIPFVANCLQVKNDENFGRFIITSHDLAPGDIIAIEEPFFKIVDSASSHLRCANCLQSNLMNLVPSDLSSSSMFCSSRCAELGKKIFHEAEVTLRCIDFTQRILLEALEICDGSFDKLSTLVNDPSTASRSFFDFDWSDPDNVKHKMDGLLTFNSLQLCPVNDELDYVQTHPVLNLFKTEREKEIAKGFMTRIARILTVNSYGMDWWSPKMPDEDRSVLASSKMKIGSAILIFGSLFNHSCAPNIDRMIVDNKFVFIVRRPIKAGEQVFISYGPSFIREPNDSRRSNLKIHFHFDCSCEACMKSYPISFNQPLTKDILIRNELQKPIKEWKEEFKWNCQEIKKNQDKFPSHLLCRLMDRNFLLLAAIARNEPFPF